MLKNRKSLVLTVYEKQINFKYTIFYSGTNFIDKETVPDIRLKKKEHFFISQFQVDSFNKGSNI